MISERIRRCLKQNDLKVLFVEELGWDKHTAPLDVFVAELGQGKPGRPCAAVSAEEVTPKRAIRLHAIAHKRGTVVYHCHVRDGDHILNTRLRDMIEREVNRSVREHLIVFTNECQTFQFWHWVRRDVGKPPQTREFVKHAELADDPLVQALERLRFSIDDEAALSLVHVTARVRSAFDTKHAQRRSRQSSHPLFGGQGWLGFEDAVTSANAAIMTQANQYPKRFTKFMSRFGALMWSCRACERVFFTPKTEETSADDTSEDEEAMLVCPWCCGRAGSEELAFSAERGREQRIRTEGWWDGDEPFNSVRQTVYRRPRSPESDDEERQSYEDYRCAECGNDIEERNGLCEICCLSLWRGERPHSDDTYQHVVRVWRCACGNFFFTPVTEPEIPEYVLVAEASGLGCPWCCDETSRFSTLGQAAAYSFDVYAR